MDLHSVDDGFFASIPGSRVVTWLNKPAAMVLFLCTGSNDEAAIARALGTVFDLVRPPLKDVQDTISDLTAAGLVTCVDRPQNVDSHLLIVVWSPGKVMDSGVCEQLVDLRESLENHGITTKLIVDRSRNSRLAHNRAASAVVAGGHTTHLLFLDATQEALAAIQVMSLAKAVHSGHGVIGFPVAMGRIDWNRVHTLARTMPDLDEKLLSAAAHSYDVHFGTSKSARIMRNGYIPAHSVSSAALLISRTALESMAGSHSTNKGRGLMLATSTVAIEKYWGFFDPLYSDEGIDLGEDISFCERARASGIEVMVDSTGNFGLSLKAAIQQKNNKLS
jgi:hypothetical protein